MRNTGEKKKTQHIQDLVISVYYNTIFLHFIQLDSIFGAIHKETFQTHL